MDGASIRYSACFMVDMLFLCQTISICAHRNIRGQEFNSDMRA